MPYSAVSASVLGEHLYDHVDVLLAALPNKQVFSCEGVGTRFDVLSVC